MLITYDPAYFRLCTIQTCVFYISNFIFNGNLWLGLSRYQRKCDELSVMNGEFKAEYNQLTTDKKEIVSFLKKSLENRGTLL